MNPLTKKQQATKLKELKAEIKSPIKITFDKGNFIVIKQSGEIIASDLKSFKNWKVMYVDTIADGNYIIFQTNNAGEQIRSKHPIKTWERIHKK